MNFELIDNNDTHRHWGDYFNDAPIMRLKLKYAETFDEMKAIISKHLKYGVKNGAVRLIYSNGDGNNNCGVFSIYKKDNCEIYLIIEY